MLLLLLSPSPVDLSLLLLLSLLRCLAFSDCRCSRRLLCFFPPVLFLFCSTHNLHQVSLKLRISALFSVALTCHSLVIQPLVRHPVFSGLGSHLLNFSLLRFYLVCFYLFCFYLVGSCLADSRILNLRLGFLLCLLPKRFHSCSFSLEFLLPHRLLPLCFTLCFTLCLILRGHMVRTHRPGIGQRQLPQCLFPLVPILLCGLLRYFCLRPL
mmetsp:Transcript_47226/g.78176  ORF Transcript_47226/g.78176 Transcript_47226/m.78176 type:complete len:211 (-) Transcript_47226:280-912(-)